MKANVQYNDYRGTTAADRSDVFIELAGQMDIIIINRFCIPLDANTNRFVGISVSGTKVDQMSVCFFFRNTQTNQVVKFYKYDVNLQDVLELFKRFEFQIGKNLDDIEENAAAEIFLEDD